MTKAILTTLVAIMSIGLWSQEAMRVAMVDVSEIEPMIRVIVLARPENAEIKKLIREADEKVASVRPLLQSLHDERDQGRKGELMKMISAAHSEQSEAGRKIEGKIKDEMNKVIKSATNGKYALVINGNAREAIISKNCELIDITMDVKEFMLINKQ